MKGAAMTHTVAPFRVLSERGSDGDLITVIVHKSGITRERAGASSASLISDR
jgi:hypothetical protein